MRTLESGQPILIQKYICNDCGHSFDARPPNYGYGNHFSNETKEKSVKGRVKTSLRNVRFFFVDLLDVKISHETIRNNVPVIPHRKWYSSGFFVYDEQYSHIQGMERFRTLLKDSKTGIFAEEIIDDLSEDNIERFLLNALSQFSIPKTIAITTDGYRYQDVLRETSRKLGIRIRRQRCLFHIEKDMAHKIREAHMEDELDLPKKLIKFMFFQTPGNLRKIGDYPSITEGMEGKSESETIQHIIGVLNRYYGDNAIISKFLSFLEENRAEVFLYLKDSKVEKTTGIAERHCSVMSWLLKHRFKTKENKRNVISNPEFLREGNAIEDTLHPDRVVVGGKSAVDIKKVCDMWEFTGASIMRVTNENAELIKYASNSFLATKISFINEIANLCERIPGADVAAVAQGIGMDHRIGKDFLRAGIGFGGSCFPKDTRALVSFAEEKGVELRIVRSTMEVNEERIRHALEMIEEEVGNLSRKNICVLGLTFKDNTNDLRESKSLELINGLRAKGAKILAYDPVINELDGVKIVSSMEECEGTDCVVVASEWKEFEANPMYEKAKKGRRPEGSPKCEGDRCLPCRKLRNT